MKQFLYQNKNTTARHEWLGLTCAFVWFFASMCSYYEPFYTELGTVLTFMLLLCAGLFGVSLLADKWPNLTDRVLLPTATIVGSICTGLIPFLPPQAAVILFWFTALLMTPLLGRRLYGLLITAKEDVRIRTYISAVSVTIVVHMIWSLLPLPFTLKFLILSMFALLGLWGSLARLPERKCEVLPQAVDVKKPAMLVRIGAIFLLLILLNIFNTLVHSYVVIDSLNNNDLFSLIAWMVAPLSFLFFAYFSDRGKERLGFAIGLVLILLGCFIALIPEGGILTAPLLITGEFGGTITEFCFLTMPLWFLPFSKRPRLVSASGFILWLIGTAVDWTQELWLPQAFLADEIGRPLIIFGAVCAIVLIPLIYSVWRRQEDATLIAALLGFKRQAERKAPDAGPQSAPSVAAGSEELADEGDWMRSLDLLESEYSIAQLLCEGLSRAEIAERMTLSPAKVAGHLHNIRVKLDSKKPIGYSPEVLRAARRYGLTARETEVLGELILGRSNAEISSNLYIEETTVKTHVGKVLKKTSMSNRSELIAKIRAEHVRTIS
jgi:DNA-binding CsgD family transcriptional regulator